MPQRCKTFICTRTPLPETLRTDRAIGTENMPHDSNDDALEQVANVQSCGGRATTPQLKRHNTPQRSGSAPRSTSASKGKRLERLSYEVQSCNKPLRSSSRRKLRKWENDNLLGLRTILKYAVNRKVDNDEDDEDDMGGRMEVNWQSMFRELTSSGNEEELHAYLKCSQSFCAVSSAPQSRTLQDCVNEWDRAEFSWSMIEKRLRVVMLRAITNLDTEIFVSVVEEILLASDVADVTGTTTLAYSIPEEVKHLFMGPLIISSPKGGGVQQSHASLVITLVDSPFHRLLLHTTCQFHGRHSKVISFTIILRVILAICV